MSEYIQDHIKNFKQRGYVLLKDFFPSFFIQYLQEYFNTLQNNNKLEKGDAQVPNSFCIYGDAAFDTVMLLSTPLLEKVIDEELLPCYTYGRIYLKDAFLSPHIDRKACEISATLSLGGESNSNWPIYLADDVPVKVELNPGDILIYKGNEIIHWRDTFLGCVQYQVFFHWVRKNGEFKNRIFDTRPYLGMPSATKTDYGY